MWARFSIRTKLTTLVVLVVTFASVSFARLAFSGLATLMNRAIGAGVGTAANSLANSIDGNWLASVDLSSPDKDWEYVKLKDHLTKLTTDGDLRRIEVVRLVDDQTIERVFSIPNDGSPDYDPPGTLRPNTFPSLKPGIRGARLSTPGTFMVGWSPVMKDGKAVGLAVVILDITYSQQAMDSITLMIIIAMFVFILLSGLTAYKFSTTFEKVAVTDGLMGLYNHKYFKQRIEQEVARSNRYGQVTCLVMMDIDFFKKVNDTYGHAVGDLVLKNMAKWVSDSIRTTDIACRYGGEEIAVILPHTGLAGAQEFAERLRLKISQQYNKVPSEDLEFRVTVSMGVAQWEKGWSPADLIKNADAALYYSKHNGRNRVTLYKDELVPDIQEAAAAKAAGH